MNQRPEVSGFFSTHVRFQDTDGDVFRIELWGARSSLTIAFALLWFAGWAVVIGAQSSEILRHGASALGAGWLVFWVAAGGAVAYPLLWVSGGKRETLLIRSGTILLKRRIGPLARSREIAPFSIRALRIMPPMARVVADLRAVRQFWTGGVGRIVIEIDDEVFACGTSLTDEEALQVLEVVARRVPLGSPPPEDAAGRPLGAKRQSVVAYVTAPMLLLVITIPARLAITDRATCFGSGDVAPRSPVDLTRLRQDGRILLVPLDDFPADAADALAVDLRRRLRAPIEVQPPFASPAGAFDPVRGQLNSETLLAVLERRYPESELRTIVIALTRADMFHPSVGWRYAFSWRKADRLAIVSPARMDRGCLGLLPASDARQLTRLRKMVGKNIGVLFYRLPLSDDPASLLYRNIGGSQELDAMSEEF